MGYFKERKTKKVDLPSDDTGKYWVEVYTDIEYGDIARAGSVRRDGTPDYVASGAGMLIQMIAGWNLDDDEGNVLEINQANVFRLSQRDAQAILTSLDEIEIEKPAEKKSSSEQST